MSLGRAVGRNTGFTALARILVLVAWFVLTPAILSRLGAEQFGFWSLLLALTGTLATLDLGLGIAVSRFTAELDAAGARHRVAALVWRSVGLQLLFAVILTAIAFALREWALRVVHVPALWIESARTAYALAVLVFVALMLANLFSGVFQGLQRMQIVLLVQVPATLVLVVLIVVALRAPRPLVALLWAQVAYAIVFALGLALALGRVAGGPAGPDPGGAGPAFGRVLRLGSWMQLSSLLGFAQTQVDKLVLGAFIALAPVGDYELGARIAYAIGLLPQFFLAALLPAATRSVVSADPMARRRAYHVVFADYAFVATLLSVALWALAPALLAAWIGRPPGNAAFMLRAIAVAQGANLLTGIVTAFVRASERGELEVRYTSICLVAHVALSLVGLRWWGWQGVLYGYLVSAVLCAAWYLVSAQRRLGLARARELMPVLATALGSALPAGLVAALVVKACLPAVPGRPDGLRALVLGAGAFGLVVGALGAIAFRPRWRSLAGRLQLLRGT